MAEARYTERGFRIYDEFKDGYRNDIRVQESSNAEGGVWVFCSDPVPKLDFRGCKSDPSPHLMSRSEIDRLIAALRDARDDLFPAESAVDPVRIVAAVLALAALAALWYLWARSVL